MTKKLRFAVIGCGNIGRKHIENIRSIEEAELVAVSDEVEQLAKSMGEKYDVDYYTDYRQMLQRDDIDIINICTPSGLHSEQAIACAEAGKHVICEKPIDITLEKADAMIAAFRKHQRKLSIISQHRFDDATVKVKELLDQGRFGKLILGTAAVNWYRSQDYYDSGEWRGTWAMDGGGALMNQSIHRIDLLQYFMGPVESVFAHCSTLGHERIEVEDVAVATVKFKNGALGTIVGTTCAYPGLNTRVEIFGENGTAIIDSERLVFTKFKDEAGEVGMYGSKEVNLHANPENDGASNPVAISSDSHVKQFLDMIEAVKNDREPLVNGEQGRIPLQIILAIYESAKTGMPVRLE